MNPFVTALAFGVMVTGFVAAALISNDTRGPQRRAVAVASAALGVITTMYLLQHPEVIDRLAGDFASQGLAVAAAAIAAALAFWKARSLFS